MSALLSFSVWLPRIRMVAPSYPGSPLRLTVTTPGSLPAIVLDRFTAGTLFNSWPWTALTAPVRVALRCSPYPTVTTVSSSTALARSRMSTTACLPSATTALASAAAYPSRLARTRCVPAGTDTTVYRPAASVCTVSVVRSTVMVTPRGGCRPPSPSRFR